MLSQVDVLNFINTQRNAIWPCNIFYKSHDGRYIDADVRTAFIAGVEGDQIENKRDIDLRWSLYNDQYQKNDQLALGQNEAIIKIEENLNLSLQPAPLLTLKQVVKDNNGYPAGVFGASLYTDEMSTPELTKILNFIHSTLPIDSNNSQVQRESPKSLEESLTRREKECAYYLCVGMSAREIALHLNLSKRTVESYVAHMKDKLQVNRKSELIKKLLDHNLHRIN